MFIAGIGNPKRKPTEKDAATHLDSKNYGASTLTQIQYSVFQYDDNTEYQFIGRSLMSRYPNPLRPK